MSLYRITTDKLEPVSRTTFAAESLLERRDLQRLLHQDISPIGLERHHDHRHPENRQHP